MVWKLVLQFTINFKNEICSANNQIVMDMIRSLIYIIAGKYFKLYNCSEKKRIIFWSKLLDDYVPKSLKAIRDTIGT